MSSPTESDLPSETPAPVYEPSKWRRRRGSRLAFYGILSLILLGILAIAIPNFFRARTVSCTNSCIANLKQLDGAKQQWALENKRAATDVPTVEEVSAFLKGGQLPECPEAGNYTLNAVAEDPTCSVPSHSLQSRN